MFISIHCGGMPFNGNTIKERSLGGSESAAYYMAKELAKEGHKVTLFTRTDEFMECDGVLYVPMGRVTEACPLGEDYHHYAMNTIVDVSIIQRHPLAFQYPWASKINLLWLHDLASHSAKDHITAQLPFIDGILTVSEWHKQQVVDTWGLNPDIVMPIQNGVDLNLYSGTNVIPAQLADAPTKDKIKLLYTSRPERGLENLVGHEGIMERLLDEPKYHLYVCNYDNTMQQMEGYYRYLYNRCNELPNVTILGHLTKQELADVQRQCEVCVYPTSFEETSCITAMECMAAGLPLLSSAVGALPETTNGAGVTLIPTIPNDDNYRGMELRVDGKVDLDAFEKELRESMFLDPSDSVNLQLAAAPRFDWSVSAGMLLSHVDNILIKANSPTGYIKDCIRNSDVYALNSFLRNAEIYDNKIVGAVNAELKECYGFIDGKWAQHYEAYYEYEKERGVDYGPESLDGNSRFEFVSSLVGMLPDKSRVLDYGCAHGHYTVNLALRFPRLSFVGIDIASSNVEKATKWAAEAGATNVTFLCGCVNGTLLELFEEGGRGRGFSIPLNEFNTIIAAEVLEHLESPAQCVDTLSKHLVDDGKMIITVPYGPWEAQGYKEHWPWRAHVHHLDRQDLHELYGMHNNFSVVTVPAGQNEYQKPLGSYVVTYDKPTGPSGVVDYQRKYAESTPRQTVSLCMIARDAQETIEKTLHSAVDIVDEVVLGIDNTSVDDTCNRVRGFCKANNIPCTVISIESPTVIGFDKARNLTLDAACGDWILWLDSDEILDNAKGLARYLRNNVFNGYAIAQHHFSMQPAGLMKTDLPVRLFRNRIGVKFFGVVHEHPELAMNEGVGHVINIPAVSIGHYGYTNEAVRRGRFHRNIELLLRDVEENPDRKLGKFLWMRDLSQMCGFELETNGMQISDNMVAKAKRGIEIFEDLISDISTLRMAIDGLEFYSNLSRVIGGGFDFNATVGSQQIMGHFHSKAHLQTLVDLIIAEEVKGYEHKKYA